jgi:Fe-S-cluster containining protein
MKKTECSCPTCVKACTSGNPGWFLPGEAEKAAEFLGLDFEKFKNTYLIIDFWSLPHKDIEVLAPIKQNIERPGHIASWGYAFEKGRCIFLTTENRCQIHPVKPLECAVTLPCGKRPEKSIRKFICEEWKKYWDQKK